MRNYVAAGLAAVLMGSGVLIATAPSASAACTDQVPGGNLMVCDGPILPDGVWKRCLAASSGYYGGLQPVCWMLGPGHVQPGGITFTPLPLNHIDDQPAAAPAATPPPAGAPAPPPPPPGAPAPPPPPLAPAPPHP